ncbi:TonB-dependent receptor [Caenibius sp. WL]|uniref:TonB-dependent receptor n=1 Tax=Caenibius sp. WL TaxID=2872646 RepID=UPI001C99FEEC|nr:TonB-dependent receptor [Caenibius sp. WL]QZP09195.1 TonB-dependent receptor [Caenibius sp. WL]
MKHFLNSSACLALAVGLAGFAPAALAQEQEAPSAEGGIAEIVVTAQHRAESLQKTPISVAALTSDAIEARGITSVTGLQSEVPNLQMTPHPNSATTTRIFIRGVGNIDDQITQDPSVAVYVDGIYVGRSQGLASDIAEIERIEVLRGPQGSLYGRNATGGAINFVSRPPQLGKFEAKQVVSVGNYDYLRTRTRLNIPLGETLAVELGYVHSEKDGYVKNRGTGVSRFGDQRRDGYRAAVRWMPTPDIDIRYSYDRSDIGDTPAYLVAMPIYPKMIDRPTESSRYVSNLRRNDVRAQGHNLTASFQLGDHLELRSLTGYRRLHNESNQNYLTGAVGPFPLFVNSFDDRQKQFSQEFQLLGSALDGQIEYVLGAYYFDESARSANTTITAASVRTDRRVTAKNRAYAVYGQGTWTPAGLDERLHLTVGARWSRDKRQATLQDVITQANGAVNVLPAGAGRNAYSNVSPTLIIAYDINPQVNAYAKVSRGYKSGGFNIRASSTQRFNQGFGPESLTAYELGFKSDLFDRRLRLNVALFNANYKDIQINMQTDPNNPTRTDVLNAGKARIYGAEIDLTAMPVDGLTLTASYGYTKAKHKKIIGLNGENIADNFVFTNIPRNSLNLGADYEFAKTSIGNFSASVNYSYQDRAYASVADKRQILPKYGLLDARLTLSEIPAGKLDLRLSAWGRNLTNKEYLVFEGAVGLPDRFGALFGEPRSYGLDLTASF